MLRTGRPLLGYIFLIFSQLAITERAEGYLQCLLGQFLALPRDSQFIQICGPHQLCYLDAYVTSAGYKRYTTGCRDKTVCYSTEHVTKRSIETRQMTNGDILVCSECCDGELCNQGGCGTPGFPTDRGPVCYACEQQTSPNTCNQINLCDSGEVCWLSPKVVNGDYLFSSSCRTVKACSEQTALIGRRDVTDNCTRCCHDNLCNIGCSDSQFNPIILPDSSTNICTDSVCCPGVRSIYGSRLCTMASLAKAICPSSCQLCPGQVITTATDHSTACKDTFSQCPAVLSVTRDVCSSRQKAEKLGCLQSCHLCNSENTEHPHTTSKPLFKTITSTYITPVSGPGAGNCVDRDKNCSRFSKEQVCKGGTYHLYGEQNCRAYCGTCG